MSSPYFSYSNILHLIESKSEKLPLSRSFQVFCQKFKKKTFAKGWLWINNWKNSKYVNCIQKTNGMKSKTEISGRWKCKIRFWNFLQYNKSLLFEKAFAIRKVKYFLLVIKFNCVYIRITIYFFYLHILIIVL